MAPPSTIPGMCLWFHDYAESNGFSEAHHHQCLLPNTAWCMASFSSPIRTSSEGTESNLPAGSCYQTCLNRIRQPTSSHYCTDTVLGLISGESSSDAIIIMKLFNANYETFGIMDGLIFCAASNPC